MAARAASAARPTAAAAATASPPAPGAPSAAWQALRHCRAASRCALAAFSLPPAAALCSAASSGAMGPRWPPATHAAASSGKDAMERRGLSERNPASAGDSPLQLGRRHQGCQAMGQVINQPRRGPRSFATKPKPAQHKCMAPGRSMTRLGQRSQHRRFHPAFLSERWPNSPPRSAEWRRRPRQRTAASCGWPGML